MIRACIFDLDGTLANTLTSIAFFGNEALGACGYQKIERDRYRYLVGDGADQLMRRMLKTAGEEVTEEKVSALRKIYDHLYESDVMYLTDSYPGITETLGEMKRRGLKLAVFSNKPHNVACEVVEKLFPKGTFDLYYGQRPEVERKPSPQGALLIAEELGVNPGECLYMGDTDVDMRTGKSAGMFTVGVLWGFREKEELLRGGADALAAQPKDLLQYL